MEVKFYLCKHCGNIITKINNSGVDVVCCGDKMVELIPGTVDASKEKHIPVYEAKDNKVYVTIGAIEHPMLSEHSIEWVGLVTSKGFQIRYLKPGMAPKTCFSYGDEEVEGVYAYCNIHGLWTS